MATLCMGIWPARLLPWRQVSPPSPAGGARPVPEASEFTQENDPARQVLGTHRIRAAGRRRRSERGNWYGERSYVLWRAGRQRGYGAGAGGAARPKPQARKKGEKENGR